MGLRFTSRQLGIVLTIAAVQFINILDFVIVMPLGPDFARALDVSEAHLGYVNGAYTAAASLAGLLGALFLDRFDRRKALAVALGGLVVGTACGGFATGLSTLLLARFVAGAFGGPATSLCFSIIADTIPVAIRGRAMGVVMAAFSVASVLGVPAGLALAEQAGWQAPFFCVAGLGVLIAIASITLLPPMREHLERHDSRPIGFGELVSRPLVQWSYLMTATVMFAGFTIIPNIASFLQLNLGFPRPQLKYAYFAGGVVSFFSAQLGGRWVDRYGSLKVGTVGTAGTLAVVFFVYFLPHTALPASLIYLSFAVFMLANGLRNVAYNTLATKVPEPQARARFQSLQSAVQHGAAAAAAVLSAQLLTKGPRPLGAEGKGDMLFGMNHVALVSMALTLAIPALLFVVERGVKGRSPPAAASTGEPLGASSGKAA